MLYFISWSHSNFCWFELFFFVIFAPPLYCSVIIESSLFGRSGGGACWIRYSHIEHYMKMMLHDRVITLLSSTTARNIEFSQLQSYTLNSFIFLLESFKLLVSSTFLTSRALSHLYQSLEPSLITDHHLARSLSHRIATLTSSWWRRSARDP